MLRGAVEGFAEPENRSGALTLPFGQSRLRRAQFLILDQQDTLSSIFLLKRGVDFKCYMYLAIPLLPFIAVIKHLNSFSYLQ
jgi:hypothetical protein